MHPLVKQLNLGQDGFLEAVAACTADPDAVAPDLLALAEQAADGTLPESAQNACFVGLHILAWARDRRLFDPLLRLLLRPDEEVSDLLGDARGNGLARFIVGCFDGNAAALFALIRNPEISAFTRSSLWGAATFLTWQGRIDATALRGLIESYDEARPVPDEDDAWLSWSVAVELLGWADLKDRVERAYADDRIPQYISEVTYFRERLAAALAAPDDPKRFEAEHLGDPKEPGKALALYHRVAKEEQDRAARAQRSPAGNDGRDSGNGGLEPSAHVSSARPTLYGTPFVRETPKIGRNDPCPCGSGKKYKRCCGAAAA